MSDPDVDDLTAIRRAMANFSPASRVEPNEEVGPDRIFTPESHRPVLYPGRQLIVGNRGMGKSLWTHALSDKATREKVASAYRQPLLMKTEVFIGFNGSDSLSAVAPTREALARALGRGFTPDDVWRAVIFRAVRSALAQPEDLHLETSLGTLRQAPQLFEDALSRADNQLRQADKTILIIFDALDRLSDNWPTIRALTLSLLRRSLGLRSFHSFRAKIFIRPDQYADSSLFQFPDGSKLKNERVDLSWQPHELFGLLLFEICRDASAKRALSTLAARLGAGSALRVAEHQGHPAEPEQRSMINALAGQFMGSDARRGRVYTWVPLHLSDAKSDCSPRTFLTAWQKAAEHRPEPQGLAVDHLGLIDGVRGASMARMEELHEDYPWIDRALAALAGQSVPMQRSTLLALWEDARTIHGILDRSASERWLAPVDLKDDADGPLRLLEAMKTIAVMEERSNGNINVPDIFRVGAGIKRRGGVAVPRKK